MTNDPRDRARRRFLAVTSAVTAGAFLPRPSVAQEQAPVAPPGPAGPATGGDVTVRTVAEAEKLANIEFTPDERRQIVESVEELLDRARARQRIDLPNDLAPAQTFRFDPAPGTATDGDAPALPADPPGGAPAADVDLAFAPVTHLARWLGSGAISSRRLTEIYLERLRRLGPELECVVTRTEDLALAQAERADRERARGHRRGPLHGIPWGAKDLFDTAGIRTTWGATPYRDRVPDRDAVVVRRLEDAGAVLVGKLSLGALAYGDVWYGGRTRNPWNRAQGSSGSSAGPAAATAAGLVGFGLGTETYGSIVSPCMRCGTTGLRPTFGRVPRTGAMNLCWSLDKIGPIARTVADCALVLAAINGADAGDPSSSTVPLGVDRAAVAGGLRVGHHPAWFEGEGADEHDRAALAALRTTGATLVEIDLPDWPYDVLLNILLVEAAAAFEELTRGGGDDTLVWQDPDAWPNTFRRTWFVPAIEYVQAERFRRRVAAMMEDRFAGVHAIISPSFAASLLLITNFTGHPSLTLRTGFRADDGTPRGITLWGRRFDEATLCRLGTALERELGVWDARPPIGG